MRYGLPGNTGIPVVASLGNMAASGGYDIAGQRHLKLSDFSCVLVHADHANVRILSVLFSQSTVCCKGACLSDTDMDCQAWLRGSKIVAG